MNPGRSEPQGRGAGDGLRSLNFAHILTPAGFQRQRRIAIDATGRIARIEVAPDGAPLDGWIALPGMPNAHSHAFQRALAGHGEAARGGDSFWSWREAMYRLAGSVGPDDLYAISLQAYREMLAGGFTSVAEFHYLHHGVDGARGSECAAAVIGAAADAGIRLLFLPVFYQRGGFGRPAGEAQARFLHGTVDEFLAGVAALPDVARGIAVHSLRAVPHGALPDLVAGADALLGRDAPLHIHVAEQLAEVEACLAATGRRPVELLADSVALDPRWSLVHATHANTAERALVIERGATVVLCPLTEAYLGDGLFATADFARGGGRLAVGSDSNVRIDAVEELRWLEYGQRLLTNSRAQLADGSGLGAPLWRRACEGGAAALAQAVGRIEPGAWADLVSLDPGESVLQGPDEPDAVLDALVTGGDSRCIDAVWVGGRRIEHGRSPAFGATARRLMARPAAAS